MSLTSGFYINYTFFLWFLMMLRPGVSETCLTPSGVCRYVSFGSQTKVFGSAQPQTAALIPGCDAVGRFD